MILHDLAFPPRVLWNNLNSRCSGYFGKLEYVRLGNLPLKPNFSKKEFMHHVIVLSLSTSGTFTHALATSRVPRPRKKLQASKGIHHARYKPMQAQLNAQIGYEIFDMILEKGHPAWNSEIKDSIHCFMRMTKRRVLHQMIPATSKDTGPFGSKSIRVQARSRNRANCQPDKFKVKT